MCDRLGDADDSGTEIPDDVDDIDAKIPVEIYPKNAKKRFVQIEEPKNIQHNEEEKRYLLKRREKGW